MNDEVRTFLDGQRVGALATTAPDGTPRQSIVYYARDGDRLLVTTLTDRAKTNDVRRSGWASLCVHGAEAPYPSVTVSGPAEILTEGIGAPTAAVVQRVTGASEPPEPQSDDALAEVGRVILRIGIERVHTTYL